MHQEVSIGAESRCQQTECEPCFVHSCVCVCVCVCVCIKKCLLVQRSDASRLNVSLAFVYSCVCMCVCVCVHMQQEERALLRM